MREGESVGQPLRQELGGSLCHGFRSMTLTCAIGLVFVLSTSGCGGDRGTPEKPNSGTPEKPTSLEPTAIARCLKQRFALVVDRHLGDRSGWFGANMVGRISVLTSDPRDASPAFTPSADIGFAEDDHEAQKFERKLREGSAIPLEQVFRRTGNVVIVWSAPATRKLRARVEGCVVSRGS
jgi:hypothetical protein